MRSFLYATLSLLLAALTLSFVYDEGERDRDPRVFRVNLDEKPRIVVLALDDDLWAAYDAPRAGLYKLWKGGIHFTGPMYDDRHLVQPQSQGFAYAVDAGTDSPWQLHAGSTTQTVQPDYRGYAIEGDRATLRYRLPLADGRTIDVAETPEYVTDAAGRPGFRRTFTLSGATDAADVRLAVSFDALEDAAHVETDGRFEATNTAARRHEWGTATAVSGVLTLNDDVTTLTAYFDPRLVAHAAAAQAQAAAEAANEAAASLASDPVAAGQRLFGQSDCASCHTMETDAIGPSLLNIARAYDAGGETVQQLAGKIIDGGSGVWGRQAMTPHPELSDAQAEAMVRYILSLDAGETAERAPGVAVNLYQTGKELTQIPELIPGQAPNRSAVVPDLAFEGTNHSISILTNDFFGLEDYFVMHAEGYLDAPEAGTYTFEVLANAGARLIVNEQKVAEVNYTKDWTRKETGTVELKEGLNPFRIEFYEDVYGSELKVRWKLPGEREFSDIPPEALSHDPRSVLATADGIKEIYEVTTPGFGAALDTHHPSFDVVSVRPPDFERPIGDLAFLSDGRLAVTTWDADGAVYVFDGVLDEDPDDVTATRIADGLYEALGIAEVDGELYVLQKWELTRLRDANGDGTMDTFDAMLDDWTATADFHEWTYGLPYRDGHFYFNTNMPLGGAPYTRDRGKTLRVSTADWTFEPIAHGYRSPNGIGFGVDGEIFTSDNEGEWVPTNKVMHVPEGEYRFFGHRGLLDESQAHLKEQPPVVWLPHNEIGNSPTQPLLFEVGPYGPQHMVLGDIHHGGLKRIFVEKVDGEYQGAIFRFTQGLDAGINRMAWGPDGHLYLAGLGGKGDFSHEGQCCGLQRFAYNGQPVFEMRAVRAKANGMEIAFSEPLRAGDGLYTSDYEVQQYGYEATEEYGAGKADLENLKVASVAVSEDRTRVFLELEGMKEGRVVYLKLPPFRSVHGRPLWSGEAWYTLNNLPDDAGTPGQALTRAHNTLRPEERADGWQLLFDGVSPQGWQPLGSGAAFSVADGMLSGSAGDAMALARPAGDFELEFEWTAREGADGGVFYRPGDAGRAAALTGPEYQLIDDANHPDARKGAAYLSGAVRGLHGAKYKLARRPGEVNQSRLVVRDGRAEHWLNGMKVSDHALENDAASGRLVFAVQEGRIDFRNLRMRAR